MKILPLAATAAILLAGSVPAFGDIPTPTWTQRSYGFFSANGPFGIEYWVDAYDSTQSLNTLRTAGHDDIYNDWIYADSTGTGSHRVSNGWGYTNYGSVDGQIWIEDYYLNYYYTTTFTF
jgi:hypothetical protein